MKKRAWTVEVLEPKPFWIKEFSAQWTIEKSTKHVHELYNFPLKFLSKSDASNWVNDKNISNICWNFIVKESK